jgi:hypothetical protein
MISRGFINTRIVTNTRKRITSSWQLDIYAEHYGQETVKHVNHMSIVQVPPPKKLPIELDAMFTHVASTTPPNPPPATCSSMLSVTRRVSSGVNFKIIEITGYSLLFSDSSLVTISLYTHFLRYSMFTADSGEFRSFLVRSWKALSSSS